VRNTNGQFKPVNSKPQLRSIDGAMRSRLKIVPCKASFVGREDPDLLFAKKPIKILLKPGINAV
jgi:hypothetical protein